MELQEVPEFSKDEYLKTTKPYEWLYGFKDNKFQLSQMTMLLKEKAKEVKVNNVSKLFKDYCQSLNSNKEIIYDNTTNFENQELELSTGEWTCDDFGIRKPNPYGGETIACNHPVMPILRLVNVDNNTEKLKLAYRKNKNWRYIVMDKKTLASSNSILELASYGIAVNSENSRSLVSYLTDIEHENSNIIPELNSVGRLGWIEGHGFSPYVENLVFDGDLQYKQMFEAIKENGEFAEWLYISRQIRKKGLLARLLLATSFASPLVKICSALPFFLHLWGGTETGKTLGLKLVASVWADTEMGRYIHTFNSTGVAQELTASFVNSLPLCLDELQIIKDIKDFDKTIYQLTEGVGKSRGAKSGGLQKVGTWSNCIITTGEQPISNQNSGGGAINRVIEIDCADIKLFENPRDVAEVLKNNYGFAGKMFIEKLKDKANVDYARKIQKDFYKKLNQGKTTEKQAMSASVILTADKLSEEWIFQDNILIKIEDIEKYLSTATQVSAHERAYEYLQDIISMNINRFDTNDNNGEIWGVCDDNYTYIIKSQFNIMLERGGYNSTAFLSWAKTKNIIETEDGRATKDKRILGKKSRCVWFKNSKNDLNEEINLLPF